MAYFMEMMLSCETIGSIRLLGIEYISFNFDIVVLWVLPWALAVSVISKSIFHPLALISLLVLGIFMFFLGFYLGNICHYSM